jgi:hypothetical protein
MSVLYGLINHMGDNMDANELVSPANFGASQPGSKATIDAQLSQKKRGQYPWTYLHPISESNEDKNIPIGKNPDDIANSDRYTSIFTMPGLLEVSEDNGLTCELAKILERASIPSRPIHPPKSTSVQKLAMSLKHEAHTEQAGCLKRDYDDFIKTWHKSDAQQLDLKHMAPGPTEGFQVLCQQFALHRVVALKVSVENPTTYKMAEILKRASTPGRPTDPTPPNCENCLCQDWEDFLNTWATINFQRLELNHMEPGPTRGFQRLCEELQLDEDILEKYPETKLMSSATMTP